MNEDLTVLYITASEVPEKFAEWQRETLLEAIGDAGLISISRKPLDFGKNILDTAERSHLNMYRQLFEAAKTVDTPYIAMAEDDTLYPPEHFTFHRPALDTFSYDMSRWILPTWSPIFSLKRRISNCTLIAPRELFIEAWEERFAKYPGDSLPKHYVGEVGRSNLDKWLKVTVHKSEKFWANVPTIQVNHPAGTDSTGRRKRHGEMRALEIPYWGRADDIVSRYV